MNRFLLLFLFLFSGFQSRSQHFAIQLDKMNVAYIGVSNPMTVVVDSTPCEDIIVFVNDVLLEGTNCNYNWSPEKPGRSSISVYVKTKSGKRLVGGMEVRTKKFPDLVFSIAGKTGGYISRSELVTSSGPEIGSPYLDYEIGTPLRGYKLQLRNGSDSSVIFERSYPILLPQGFDDESVTQIARLTHNDIVIITDVVTGNLDGMARSYGPLTFRIAH